MTRCAVLMVTAPLSFDLNPDAVDVDDRIDLIQRAVAPDLDFVGYHLGDPGDQLAPRLHRRRMLYGILNVYPVIPW